MGAIGTFFDWLFGSKREYGVKSVTKRGEEVRSIAERKIADYFFGKQH